MDPVLIRDFQEISPYIPKRDELYGARWLITGATGVIGSYLLSFLSWFNETELDGSMRMTVIHRNEITPSHLTVGHLLGRPYLEFRRIDLSKEFSLHDSDRYDVVFHGASNAAPRAYLADPLDTINTNVRATQFMLEHFKDHKPLKVFLYVSSGEIYGSPGASDVPTPEEYLGVTNHLTPRSCYVEAKRFGETLCWNYFSVHKVPIKIIRPVHVYGPGFTKNDSRVWADFIVKACLNNNIEILSDGSARRGFCYLADAMVQIFTVIQKGGIGEVYNIGSEDHVSIKELASVVAEKSGNEIDVVIKNALPDYLKGSPQISCPSIQKVKALAPVLSTSLGRGIEKSVEWFYSVLER